ncbi:MAG: sensor histidine kinase, partial [Conexibacter sp.]|nr:sensor histidine kinase [Conexibacter sp.]
MTSRTVSAGAHPLDLIPLFRRWPCSPIRNVVYTGLWNTLIALFLTAVNQMSGSRGHGFIDYFVPIWLISNLVGYLIHIALASLQWALRGWPSRVGGMTSVLYYVAVIAICVLLGIAVGNALLKGLHPLYYLERSAVMAPLVPFALLMAVFMFLVGKSSQRR